jgi:hypothetical protein
MEFKIGSIFSIVAFIFAFYLIFLGITNPGAMTYVQPLIFVVLLSISGFFIVMGANNDAKARD